MKLDTVLYLEERSDCIYLRKRNAIVKFNYCAIAYPYNGDVHYYSVHSGKLKCTDKNKTIYEIEKKLDELNKKEKELSADIAFLNYCKEKFKELPQYKIDWLVTLKEKEGFYKVLS